MSRNVERIEFIGELVGVEKHDTEKGVQLVTIRTTGDVGNWHCHVLCREIDKEDSPQKTQFCALCESASKERDALQARVKELEEALQNLCDVQSGPPLPDYADSWNAERLVAIRAADKLLAPAALSEQGDTANESV